MATYIAHEIQEAEAYWTLLDLSSGADLRASHRFPAKAEAEEAADLMNGVEPEEGEVPPASEETSL